MADPVAQSACQMTARALVAVGLCVAAGCVGPEPYRRGADSAGAGGAIGPGAGAGAGAAGPGTDAGGAGGVDGVAGREGINVDGPVVSPLAGTWVGETSLGAPIGFTVDGDGRVDSLILFVDMTLPQSVCAGLFRPSNAAARATIRDSRFEIGVLLPDGDPYTLVNGTFAGTDTASGSYAGFDGPYTLTCDGSQVDGSGALFSSGTWRATRGSLPCRTGTRDLTNEGRCDEPAGSYACVRGADARDCAGGAGGGSGGGRGGATAGAGGAGGGSSGGRGGATAGAGGAGRGGAGGFAIAGAGGFGRGGGGGAGGAAPADDLGKPCDSAVNCGVGFVCARAADPVFATGGPAHGMCTKACGTSATGDSCGPIGGVCVDMSRTATPAPFCMQRCAVGGTARASKCRGRADMGCATLGNGTGAPVDACLPICATDADCPVGRFCSPATGLCEAAPAGGDPLGSYCRTQPDGGASSCAGTCIELGTATVVTAGFCSQACVIGTASACNPALGTMSLAGASRGLCAFAPTGAVAGDIGYCAQQCDTAADCLDKIDPGGWCETASLAATTFAPHGFCSW
jgi:hypothetical protein